MEDPPPKGSQIWTPYRALGLVVDSGAVSVERLGGKNFITAAVGTSCHTYEGDKLRLLFVSPLGSARVRCIATKSHNVFVGAGSQLSLFVRGLRVAHWPVRPASSAGDDGHDASAAAASSSSDRSGSDDESSAPLPPPPAPTVTALLVFGEHLLSLSSDNAVRVWETGRESIGTLYAELELDAAAFAVTAMMHPATYLNKIVLGSTQGALRLYNIRTLKCVFEFPSFGAAVRVIEQSPALDIVGVGLVDGRLVIHNLKDNETLRVFHQSDSPVTAVSFRTDGVPTVVTAGTHGRLSVWDLDRGVLVAQHRGLHDSTIEAAVFFQGEPVLLTAGSDNALKLWVFDQADGTARLLKFRAGHARPPTRARFYGDERQLLTCGLDRMLRVTSTIRDAHNVELSQRKGAGATRVDGKAIGAEYGDERDARLPVCIDFDVCTAKDRRWDSVLSIHASEPSAYTWRFTARRIGTNRLVAPGADAAVAARSVAISVCGNYGLVGYASGRIHKFNMQSGIHRGGFGLGAAAGDAHRGAVLGLAVNALNLVLVSGALDGLIKFWNLDSHALMATADVGSPVTVLRMHRESGLVAVACDDLVLRVLDSESQRVVRRFEGHSNRITDLALSADSRWLLSASMDCTVRVWDLACARCLDVVRFAEAVTSLDLSPDDSLLATTHVNAKGVFLWGNRAHFGRLVMRPVDQDCDVATLPSVVVLGEAGSDALDGEAAAAEGEEDVDAAAGVAESAESLAAAAADWYSNVAAHIGAATLMADAARSLPMATAAASGMDAAAETPAPLGAGLITLSSLPPSRWMHLAKLDLVRQRNKPIEPPKAPVQAPFFLPTLAGLTPTFDLEAVAKAGDPAHTGSRVLNFGNLKADTAWTRALRSGADSGGDYARVVALTKSMTPSAVEFELRSLADDADDLALLLAFLLAGLRSRVDFDLYDVMLQVTLAAGRDLLAAQGPRFAALLEELEAEMRAAWETLDQLLDSTQCLVKLFRGVAQ